jgi:hypothetical protein
MNQVAAEGGGSGGGGTSFFTAPTGGGGTGVPQAGSSGSNGGADTGKPTGASSNANATQGGTSSDWKSVLPKELQEDATLKKFTSVDALAGAYVSAQKLIGADKIPVPTKHTTPEEFRQVLHRIGLPEAAEKYEIKFKQEAGVEEEFAKSFKEQAFKAGVLPNQAQALAEWLSDLKLSTVKQFDEEATKRHQTTAASLKKDWGSAYQQKLARANKALFDMGGEGVVDHFNKLGVAADEKFVRLMAAVGDKLYGEHTVIDGSGSAGKTPVEIDKEIAALRTSPAFLDKHHPSHKAVIQEYTALFQQRYPVDKK